MVFSPRSRRPVLATTVAGLLALATAGLGVAGAGAAPGQAPPPSPAQSRALAAKSAGDLVAGRAAVLHASQDDAFAAKPVQSVPEGVQYVPYERTHKGLPVVGGDFVVVTDKFGNVQATSVAQTTKIGSLSVTPTVSAGRAEQIARGRLTKVDRSVAPTLVVHALGAPRLAWQARVAGANGNDMSDLTVYVDARSGKVIDTQEHVLNGDGTAAYSGPNPVHLDTQQQGATFFMRDPARPTLQCQDFANSQTFSGPDDLWGNGNATNKETGCVDGLFAMQTEQKMMTQWLGRNGMDGNGGWVPQRVGLNDLNAFYDGTRVAIGHNQQNQWISSIDVVAHEYGHGVDDHTPGGISRAGTQEFVADVFGAATEAFSNQGASFDPPDYLVGEEINLVGTGPIRNMYNPSLVNNDPNCYSSAIPGTEVHKAAGPGNHWFYLTAEGSSPGGGKPNSPTCNGSTVTGIGVQKATRILYGAMLMKTTASSYLRYRTWTLTAAKNLFAPSCAEYNAVKAAWNAVSVPQQTDEPTCTGGPGTPTVNNPGNQTGTVGTAVSLTLTATGGTPPYTWSATGLPPGLSISSGGVISGTPTTAGTFNVTATATDSASPPASGSASFTWTINPVGGGCSSPGQKFGNPGFESGNNGVWSATAGVVDNSAGRPARTGSWKAWLDGYGVSHTDTLSQSVAIPAGCRATLSFYLRLDSSETTTTIQYDKLTVRAGSTVLATYSNLDKNPTYVLKSFDVSSFAGSTVSFNFTGVEDVSLQTSFVIDDTSLTLS